MPACAAPGPGSPRPNGRRVAFIMYFASPGFLFLAILEYSTKNRRPRRRRLLAPIASGVQDRDAYRNKSRVLGLAASHAGRATPHLGQDKPSVAGGYDGKS